MKRFIPLFLLGLFSASVFISSCTDDFEFGSVEVRYNMKANDQDLVYNTEYTFDGVKMSFQTMQFYISGMSFVNDQGQELFMDNYLLIKPDGTKYSVGDLLTGNYTKIRFDVGIDATTNHEDPSAYAVGSVLGAQFPAMHWSWNMGYIFFRIDGMVDTIGSGILDAPIAYHLGTDDYLTSIELEISELLEDGDEMFVDINLNLDKVLEGIDLTTERISHTTDNIPLAEKVIDNVDDAFSIVD